MQLEQSSLTAKERKRETKNFFVRLLLSKADTKNRRNYSSVKTQFTRTNTKPFERRKVINVPTDYGVSFLYFMAYSRLGKLSQSLGRVKLKFKH